MSAVCRPLGCRDLPLPDIVGSVEQARDPLFAADGEMPARLAGVEWAATALGPASAWSQSLRTAVAIMLETRYPMLLSWGEDLVMLYNDAFIPTLGSKHPAVLGGPLRDAFAEIWDAVGPLQHGVLRGEGSTWAEDLPLMIERGDGPEETFFTFSYSRVPDEAGPGGVLAVLSVTTAKVVGARRLSVLNRLASLVGDADDPDAAVELAAGVLGDARDDLEHGLLFRVEEDAPGSEVGPVWGGFGDPVVSHEELAAAAADALRARALVVRRPDPGSPHRVVAVPVRGAGAQPTGVLVLVPSRARPLDDEHRHFLGLVADQLAQSLLVATDRAREQARLEALAAIDAAKSAFLSNVSHEFRTPLTLLLGPLEDVLGGTVDHVDRESAAAMHDAGLRLLRLVNGLLEVARMEAGGTRPELEPTDIAALTTDLVQLFTPTAQRAGLRLDVTADAGLGVVDLDPLLWDRIVVNLVANALKYTLAGRIDVRLARVHGPAGDQVRLTVADTGVGIPPEELPRVFDRFHRVPGADARTIEGTGLGLALVSDAAAALGGDATATSTVGAGSTFTVTVPLVESAVQSAGTSVAARSAGSPAQPDRVEALAREVAGELGASLPPSELDPASDGPLVLVVDDNPGVRERVARLVGRLGRVVTAADGLAALELLRRLPVDLVVTDVMMPRLDGLGLVRAIRDDPALASVPVVMLSARAGAEAATEAVEAGADDYVVKPFTPAELVARCRTTLELAAHRRRAAEAGVRQTLLAGISHDMQTPVSVLLASLEALASDELTPDQRGQVARRAAARGRYLRRLVAQFLDWSRLSLGEELPVSVRPTDLMALVTGVCRDHPDVTVTCPDRHVRAVLDQLRTEQILHNLLDNACRVARTRVEVCVEEAGSEVLVHVRDDGPGIPDEMRAGLFRAFAASSSRDGNGLGLHVSRESARAQGGELALGGTGEHGTTMTLALPAEVAHAPAAR